jgi:hypothetical protein
MEAVESEQYPARYLEALVKQILEHSDYVGRDESGRIVMTLTMDDFLYDELCLVGDDGDEEDDGDVI